MLSKRGFVVVFASVVLAGCGGSGGGIVTLQAPRVRLFNGVDGESTIYATFQDANLNNLGVSSHAATGAATIDTLLSDTTATSTIYASTGALVTTPPFLYREDSYYTLYAYGAAFQGYSGIVIADSQLVSTGTTFGFRGVQIGMKNPTVDIYVEPGNTPLSASNLVFSSVAYGTVSGSTNTVQAVDSNGYVLSPVNGTTLYTVYVTVHGSTTPIATSSVTVAQGSYYTAVVYDSPVGSAAPTSVAVLGDHRVN